MIPLPNINPWSILIGVTLLGGAYVWGRSDGEAIAEGQRAKEDRIAKVATDASRKAAAEAIAGIVVTNTTIKQEVQREIRTKLVYTECRHSPDGLRGVNAALTGEPFPVGVGQLPPADPPRR